MKYVIIGNSTAAVGCIEGIRQIDNDGEIVVISKEGYHTYSRPLISYFLGGKLSCIDDLMYRKDAFYEQNKCELMLNKTVGSIDAKKKTVQLDDGTTVSYDKLMIATGSKPFVPKTEGAENVGKMFTFMSYDDALNLKAVVTPDSKVLIVGAGLIGLKCAEGLYGNAKEITVIDMADRILPSILDEKESAIVQKHVEEHGIKFILKTSVKQFTADNAELANGIKIDYDIVVMAVGVRPNTELASEAGALVRRGIAVDELGRTSLEDVYAAGDCCESFDISINQNRILALLPNAYFQGECAGINMAGGAKNFEKAIPMNAIGFFGLHMLTAGDYTGEQYIKQTDKNYKKLVTDNNLLKGFVLIGDIARAGIYTNMIRNQTPLDSIDFDLIKENPQLMAFEKDVRVKALNNN